MKIANVHARQILDSRGNPTLEADVILEDGSLGRAGVPSGASTGTHEALELRDGDKSKYGGKGVLNAVNNINTEIARKIIGMDASDQKALDAALIELDGTTDKSRLGANAILAVSLSAAKAEALSQKIPLYEYVKNISQGTNAEKKEYLMPMPMVNILNGGAHTNWESTDIQEFMIMPVSAKDFAQAMQMCSEVFHALGKVLEGKGYSTSVGDEGGYAPKVKGGNTEALNLIKESVEKAGYALGPDIVIALDCAASELYEKGSYNLRIENKKLSTDELIAWYKKLVQEFHIVSIEDGLSEEDWEGWQRMTLVLGDSVRLVGDDLFVTNTKFLERGIREKSGNALLVKPNQIGTLTETIEAVKMADAAGFKSVMSHRSGETEDTTIAHLAVGLSTGQIKTGSMCRSERMAKYNELLRIEEALGKNSVLAKL